MTRSNRPVTSKARHQSGIALALLVMVSFLALFSANVAALGIASGRVNYNFESGLTKTVTLRIINNEHKDISVALFTRGELAQYISSDASLITMTKAENERAFTYTFKLPDKLDQPGEHMGEIVALQLPPSEQPKSGGMVIEADIAVISQLAITVPYPGKYLQADLFIPSTEYGKPVEATASLYNVGTDDLKSITGTLEILGPTNERVAEAEFSTIPLSSKVMGKITATVEDKLNPGTYHAVARLEFDGQKIRRETDFTVGQKYVEVVKIESDDFRLGEIAKFDITLENRWNKDLTDVYGEMTLLDKTGATLASTKTASVDIAAKEREKIIAYLNTQSLNPGTYDLDVTVHYDDLQTRQRSEIEVGFDSVHFSGTGRVVAPKIFGQNAILAVLLVVLVGMNMIWFFYIRKIVKPKKPGGGASSPASVSPPAAQPPS